MSITKPTGMPGKKIMTAMLGIIALIVLCYIIKRQILLLPIIALICFMILLVPLRESVCILFMISPFANLFSYNQINMYIFIVAACLFKIVLNSRFLKALFFMILLIGYCILFINKDVSFRIGSFIEPILLMATLFVCGAAPRDVYRPATNCYTIGFIISAIVGLFKNELPAMKKLFGVDTLYVEGMEESGDMLRYSGLNIDPNFFAVVSYVLISIILFTNKKLNKKQILAVVTLLIFGLFTYSKSYILSVVAILIIYMLKNSVHIVRNTVFVGCVFIALIVVENVVKVDVLSLIFARLGSAEDANGLTSGRLELWAEYITYIFEDVQRLFWGVGFNASAINKAAHSCYLDFLYRFGIVGCALWTAYTVSCIRYVSHVGEEKLKAVTGIPILVFMVGFAFLSALHFKQLWILSCLVLFATYMPQEEEEDAEAQYNSADLQRRSVINQMY